MEWSFKLLLALVLITGFVGIMADLFAQNRRVKSGYSRYKADGCPSDRSKEPIQPPRKLPPSEEDARE